MNLKRFSVVFLSTILTLSASAETVLTGTGTSTPAAARVFENGAEVNAVVPFSPFTGGVTVAYGDVNGDGAADIITGTATTSSQVKIFSGTTNEVLANYLAFDASHTFGIYVAAGDVNGDGLDDVIVGAGQGAAPSVKVFHANTDDVLMNFMAFVPTFTGGVRVASADFDGDKLFDVVAGNGPGRTSQVRVYSAAAFGGAVLWAFSPNVFSAGIFVAAGDLDGDGVGDIVVSNDEGGSPEVGVFDGAARSGVTGFEAFETSYTGGVRVAISTNDADGARYILTGTGKYRAAEVRVFPYPLAPWDFFFPFGSNLNGVFVAGIDSKPTATIIDNSHLCTSPGTATIEVALTGVAPWSLTWSDGLVQNDIASPNHFRVVSNAGTYSLTKVSDRNHRHGKVEGLATVTNSAKPVFTQQPVSQQTIIAGQTATISATATSAGPVTYQWYRGIPPSGELIAGATNATLTASPTTTTWYYVVASNGFCEESSQPSWVRVQPSRPSNVIATATTTTSVSISWTASVNGASYGVYRKSPGGAFTLLTTTSSTSYVDSGLTPMTSYIYRIVAVSSDGLLSPDSMPDQATTIMFTDPSLTIDVSKVKAVHITELRQAVNAMRAAAGLGAMTVTDATLTAGSTRIKAVHITELRSALDAARSALGLFAIPYTDASIVAGAGTIKAVHVTQLRSGV